jgi:hypothetical protein
MLVDECLYCVGAPKYGYVGLSGVFESDGTAYGNTVGTAHGTAFEHAYKS